MRYNSLFDFILPILLTYPVFVQQIEVCVCRLYIPDESLVLLWSEVNPVLVESPVWFTVQLEIVGQQVGQGNATFSLYARYSDISNIHLSNIPVVSLPSPGECGAAPHHGHAAHELSLGQQQNHCR